MTKICLLFAVLLAACSVAVGQSPYQLKNFQGGTRDVTTNTNTYNAWKGIGGVCQSLSPTFDSLWCLASGNNYVYKFNTVTKGWDAQTAMGSGVFRLAVANSQAVFALIHNSYCDAGEYAVSQWNSSGSAWNAPFNVCGVNLAAGMDGTTIVLELINSVGQLWSSTDLGHTWTRQVPTNTWVYASLGIDGLGCAVDSSHTMWRIASEQIQDSLPSIPSINGSVVGCIWADDPAVALAWTTTGYVYSMPIENFGTWQVVAGLSAKTLAGISRFNVLAEDNGGNVFHWNVNAPGLTATYGGQWSQQNGCPTPSVPCNSPATHTVNGHIYFKSGHGIDGVQRSVTGPFLNDLETYPEDFNALCDPFYGLSGDIECQMVVETDAECNQSHESLGSSGDINWVIDDTIDIMAYTSNQGQAGPMNVHTGPNSGYIVGQVYNWTRDACRVTDPVPVCPVDTNIPLVIHNQVNWTMEYWYPSALSEWQYFQNESISGVNSPYAVHGFYTGETVNGVLQLDTVSCFGGWIREDDFLWGNYDDAPHCK